MNEPRVTKALDAGSRARLFALVQERNELAVLRAIGISRTALTRALAGLPIYGGTRAAIEAGLVAFDASDRAKRLAAEAPVFATVATTQK